jgi:DNA-binding LytR/AlgR family response regulator
MIQCIIVDDEDLARAQMRRLLKAHQDFEISGEASNGVDALELITEQKPDVAFLDVEMPALNAFEVISQLRHPPVIVFTTAFDTYAVGAFDANALDDLLKPIQPVRLAQTVDRIRGTVGKPHGEYESILRRTAAMRRGAPSKLAARGGVALSCCHRERSFIFRSRTSSSSTTLQRNDSSRIGRFQSLKNCWGLRDSFE